MNIDEKKEIKKPLETLKNIKSLPFKAKKNCISQDPLFPISNLEINNQNNGWISEKLCSYPQKIIIKFDDYVNIKQINIIINESKIPKKIEFINCIKISDNPDKNKNIYKYENIGFIKLSSNEQSNYKSREMREIPINIYNTTRIKLLIYENYNNSLNPYNQVGIVSLEFIGNFVDEEKNNNFIKNNLYASKINEESNENGENDDEEEEEMEKSENNIDKEENKDGEEVEEEEEYEEDENKEEAKKDKKRNNIDKKEKNVIKRDNNENTEKKAIKPPIKIKGILKNKTITSTSGYNENDSNKNNIKIIRHIKKDNKLNDNIKNNDDDNLKNKQLYQNKKQTNNEKYSGKNMESIIREKINILNLEIQKKKKNNEYNEFTKLQNEINELKKLLNKINNMKSFKESVKEDELKNEIQYNYLNKEKYNKFYTPNKNPNFSKVKTVNEKNLFSFNPKLALGPSDKNNTLKSQEVSQNKNIRSKLITKTFKIVEAKNRPFNLKSISNDNLVFLTIKNKNKVNNDKIYNGLEEDSLNYSNENIENDSLEELASEIREKNTYLINILGEDIIQKIYSNNIYYKNEGFNALNLRVNDIIVFSPENEEETNENILSLINIFFTFIDDNHPSIVMQNIELFMNIIKSIKDKSLLNKIDYDFKITKPVINKIIEKLSHDSKRIREKAFELYCYLLDSNFCDFNTLIIELIQNEVNEYFYKLNIINNNNYSSRVNSAWSGIGMSKGMSYLKNLNKNLIISKMNIFLHIFSHKEKFNIKFKNRIFPETIVGDFIIMNIHNPKVEIRDITKNVLAKYISIFGNHIFYKLKMIIGNKDLLRIIQDNDELLLELRKYEDEKNQKFKETKILLNGMKFKNKKIEPLSPIKIGINNNYKQFSPKYIHKFEKINFGNKPLMRISSLPKLIDIKKSKLKPINKVDSYLLSQEKNLYMKKKTYSINNINS